MAGEKSIMYDPILGQFRRKDKGGGSDFDPNGIYPGLTAGNLLAKETDAVKDNRVSFLFRSTFVSPSLCLRSLFASDRRVDRR